MQLNRAAKVISRKGKHGFVGAEGAEYTPYKHPILYYITLFFRLSNRIAHRGKPLKKYEKQPLKLSHTLESALPQTYNEL